MREGEGSENRGAKVISSRGYVAIIVLANLLGR